jgi:hypothetical protein
MEYRWLTSSRLGYLIPKRVLAGDRRPHLFAATLWQQREPVTYHDFESHEAAKLLKEFNGLYYLRLPDLLLLSLWK